MFQVLFPVEAGCSEYSFFMKALYVKTNMVISFCLVEKLVCLFSGM